MNRLDHKRQNATRRSNRVRSNVTGTAERPRLCVRITNRRIWAQVINDELSKTICAVTVAPKTGVSLTSQAEVAGAEIAKAAKAAKVSKVVLDRGERKYHGRVKVFADKARAEGLEF